MTATQPLFGGSGVLVESTQQQHSLAALDRAEVSAWFEQQGLILFRGFSPSGSEFHAFSSEFCAAFDSYVGRPRTEIDDVMRMSAPGDHGPRVYEPEREPTRNTEPLSISTGGPGLPASVEGGHVGRSPETMWIRCETA